VEKIGRKENKQTVNPGKIPTKSTNLNVEEIKEEPERTIADSLDFGEDANVEA
jgi:hypothetical protein